MATSVMSVIRAGRNNTELPEKQEQLTQRRAFERIIAKLEVRFFYGKMFYPGVVTDLSENGMFIRSRITPPVESVLPVIIRQEKGLLTVLARVKWTRKPFDHDNPGGMGVEIMNPSQDYFEFTNCKK
ncbi:MAG: PilZ domain-containing protein [Nitrospirae bacterium]|nr:PilZ domain-containing protein [Nitrospirota bacterium]